MRSYTKRFTILLLNLIAHASLAAPMAYVTNRIDGTVSAIDLATNTVVDTIAVGNFAWGVAILPDGSSVFVTNQNDNTVSEIDTATNSVVNTIPVGAAPWGITSSIDGTALYVSNLDADTVSVIETATNTVVDTIPVGNRPRGIAVHPNGGTVYVADEFDNRVSAIDTTTNTVIDTVAVGLWPRAVTFNEDGTLLYVTNERSADLSVVDVNAGTLADTVVISSSLFSPFGVAVRPGGNIYVANNGDATVSVVDPSTNTEIAVVPVGANPRGVAVHPAGTSVYVANDGGGSVSVIDTNTNTVVDTITLSAGTVALGRFIASMGLGGAVAGLDTTFVLCANLTVPQSLPLPLQGATSWDCEEEGLQADTGDRVRLTLRGTANAGDQPIAGGLTGFFPSFAFCTNQTTAASVFVLLQGSTSWDCESAGLTANARDSIRVIIGGRSH